MSVPDPSLSLTRARTRMVERLRSSGIRDEGVLAAILAVPRHQFVEEALGTRAYEDTALPLGFQQTISQPFVVARMIELLRAGRASFGQDAGGRGRVRLSGRRPVEAGNRCLCSRADCAAARTREAQSASAASAERAPEVHADGRSDWLPKRPSIQSSSPRRRLRCRCRFWNKLAEGGRLIIPVGTTDQSLRLIERQPQRYVESKLDAVRFVPLLPGVE
jgi:protein-L-isoaspartate(D-aspartate) O-methyltransferase